jgi:hypothetical protein
MRVILDAAQDVFRDLEVESSATLEDFHNIIVQSFSLPGEEMASFYTADEEWRQQDEIPLFDMESASPRNMGTTVITEVADKDDNHLIYVYDYLNMWTFLIEVVDVITTTDGTSYPRVVYSMGELPDSPPDRNFESESVEDLYGDDEYLEDRDEYSDGYDVEDY